MIRGTRPQQSGFTIIEVIIYLTISIAIVAGSIGLFTTRIPKTQFNQALVELDQKIRDTSGEVASGFYPSTANINCVGTTISRSSGDGQGSNADCIFLGRAIQFGPSEDGCSSVGGEDCDTLKIYSIWGSRINGLNGKPVSTLEDSEPRFLDPTEIQAERFKTGFGLYVTRVLPVDGTSVGGVAFLQTFGTPNIAGSDDLPSGASQVEMRTIQGTLGQPENAFTRFSGSSYEDLWGNGLSASSNPGSGVVLCLRSAVSEQYAIMTIGDGSRPLSTKTEIVSRAQWDGGVCG